jgi:hypothetical protein
MRLVGDSSFSISRGLCIYWKIPFPLRGDISRWHLGKKCEKGKRKRWKALKKRKKGERKIENGK